MRPVVIESPYAGEVERNTRYVRAIMRYCLLRGWAPFPSHALYTLPGVLDDADPKQREAGILAGFAIAEALAAAGAERLIGMNYGISDGMRRGLRHAQSIGQKVRPLWLSEEFVDGPPRDDRGEGSERAMVIEPSPEPVDPLDPYPMPEEPEG